jgi:glucokinase
VRHAIGIDLGGTNIKAARVSEDGTVLGQASGQTRDGAVASTWVTTVRELVARLQAPGAEGAGGIGVAAPGMAAADGRSVRYMRGRLAGLQGLDWAEALGATVPVRVMNDAHAGLLGEAWTGAAAGAREAVLLTLGTGVGGAILTGGRILGGATGKAGHWGHVTVDADGPPSIAGMPGSLEGAIGNCTVAERSGGRFRDTRDLVAAHLAGDAEATAVWLRSVHRLACAIASIVNALDPEVVILGGGIARAGPALFEPLAGFLDAVEWRPLGHGVRVVPAALGELAGAIGAARSVLTPASTGT